MCPRTFNLQILILLAVGVMIYAYRRQIERAGINAETVKSFLKAPEMRYGVLGINFTLEGWYKDRKVVYFYRLDSECNGSDYNLYMEPKHAVPTNRFFILKYPRPTQNTCLRGNKVFYSKWSPLRGGFLNLGGMALFSEEEIRAVLEELAQAAEQVENKFGKI
jgi:hypothetical protein